MTLSAQGTRPAAAARPQVAWQAVTLALIMLAGLILRVVHLNDTSLWLDEAVSWEQSGNTLRGLLSATARDNYPPLHNILLFVTRAVLGDSEAALRLPSALLGTATIWVTWRLGAAALNPAAGLVAALLVCLSPFHIWYSVEARMYALLGFTATFYAWTALLAWHSDRAGPRLACIVAAVLLLYSHVYGAFILTGITLAVLAEAWLAGPAARPQVWRWLRGHAIAVAIFLPWAVLLLLRIPATESSIGWIPDPTVDHVSGIAVRLLGGPLSVWAMALVLAAALVAPWLRPAPGPADRPARLAVLILCGWIVVPFAIGLALSYLLTPVLVDRYLLGQLPAICLLFGLIVVTAFRTRALRMAAVAALALPALLQMPTLGAPSWRTDLGPDLAAWHRLSRPDDTVVHVPYRDPTFDYYIRDAGRIDQRRGEASLTDLATLDRLWLFGPIHPQSRFQALKARLAQAGFAEAHRSANPEVTFSLFVRGPADAR